ncbi:MAG: hypothetical protein LBC14_01425 [Desulfovibrio sp.]|jgi:hypothetical protein|nr:hypothetical protein [Desulfovibrio sp.]
MTTITFDTLSYFEKLTSAGMPEPLAKVQADALREVIESKFANDDKNLATKADINALKAAMAEQKHELLKWMLGIALAQIGIMSAILRALSVIK